MTTISDRIRQVRAYFCESNLEFAQLMETKPNVTSNWINRKASEKVAMKVAEKFPMINPNWLVEGEGEMLDPEKMEELRKEEVRRQLPNSKAYYDTAEDEVYSIPYENYIEVEYADLSTSAGLMGRVIPEHLPQTKRKLIPREFEKGNYLVVKIDGDSTDDGTNMSIPDGSEILIREVFLMPGEKLPIRNNLFVIVSMEGTVFKQIIEHNIEKGYIRCHSYNSEYEDYDIPLEEILQVFVYHKIVSLRPSIPEIRRRV